jgi:hypothetical protein
MLCYERAEVEARHTLRAFARVSYHVTMPSVDSGAQAFVAGRSFGPRCPSQRGARRK